MAWGPVLDEIRLPITAHGDIVNARQEGRRVAAEMGFSSTDVALIITSISELARNIVQYARQGELVLVINHSNPHPGLVVIARDNGPGIPDIRKAMQDGYSTSGGLGLGLPGVRRLMDEFDIASEVGKGTTVTIKKYLPEIRR